MLLLVVQSHSYRPRQIVGNPRRVIEQITHVTIHMGAVFINLCHAGPRDESPLGTGSLFPYAVVIGVEQHTELGLKGLVARYRLLEHQRFEEPGCVCEVPFHRARVGHGLGSRVFRRQGSAKTLAGRSHELVLGCQGLNPVAGCGPWGSGRHRFGLEAHGASNVPVRRPASTTRCRSPV